MSYVKKLQDSAKRKIKIKELYKKGMTPSELGLKFGLTRQRIHQIVGSKKK